MEWSSIPKNTWRPCPDDGSPLVELGDWSATRDVPGVSEFYCPRCDAAFLAILREQGSDQASRVGGPIEQVLRWSREGGELEPDGGYPPGVFSERQWEVRSKNLRYHVRGFLEARQLDEPRGFACLFDGSMGAVIGTLTDDDGNSYTLGWCRYCRIAVAYIRDVDYGWEAAATFGWKEADVAYQLRDVRQRQGRATVNDQSLITMASRIPPANCA
jgi:hypothetical protein